MKVLIVGGGIGGLTAAIALRRAGHEVTLVEQAPRFSPLGAGIVMAPNATRLLAALGVDLAPHGHPLPSMNVLRHDGVVLQALDWRGEASGFGPTFALTRPALGEALLAGLPSGVEVVTGRQVTGLVQSPEGVEVMLGGEPQARRADLVVGADGLHSTVRRLTVGEWPVRYSGVTCWRGLLPNPGFEGALEAWGGAARVGVVPLREGQLYTFLVLAAPRRAPAPSWPEGFRAAFGQLEAAVPGLLDALPGPPPLHHDLEELERPVWGRGRVVLLGDAAHAMTPNQGQGAAMAIEDAYALPRALEGGAAGAVERFQALRHDRVATVQRDSRRLGQVAHWENPVGRALRDGALRLLPASVGARQLRRVIEPGLALLDAAR